MAGAVGVWLFNRHWIAGGGVKTAALLGAASGVGGGSGLAIAGVAYGVVAMLVERFGRPGAPDWTFRSTPPLLVITLAGLAAQRLLDGPA